ncbi:unnamed protein product [Cuscuta europaea]|uniref:Pectin acetylesterase n=1 Tax=Cuscuta europaea TaxID=41803 RepID=A0A9P1E396_CUSEU|nr:unnamed protein product [Cuscuta europaea]
MGFALKGFGEVLLITSIMAAAAALPNDGNPNLVNATLVKADKKAVCLLGNPAAYFHAPGYGKGIQNWIVYLPGPKAGRCSVKAGRLLCFFSRINSTASNTGRRSQKSGGFCEPCVIFVDFICSSG